MEQGAKLGVELLLFCSLVMFKCFFVYIWKNREHFISNRKSIFKKNPQGYMCKNSIPIFLKRFQIFLIHVNFIPNTCIASNLFVSVSHKISHRKSIFISWSVISSASARNEQQQIPSLLFSLGMLSTCTSAVLLAWLLLLLYKLFLLSWFRVSTEDARDRVVLVVAVMGAGPMDSISVKQNPGC